MDPASISTLLGSVKTAIDIAKFFKDSDLSLEKAEAKLKLADLISALADAKIQISDIQQALGEKDAEIRKLQNTLSQKANLRWEAPYYWSDEAGKRDGPFCQRCYDDERKLIRLQENVVGFWSCMACHNSVVDARYRPTTSTTSDYDPFKDL